MIQLLLYGDIKMSGSVNKVTLVGNLGRDPEVRAMQNGDKIVQLSIATSDRWKDKSSGEQKEKVEWHRVVLFNRLAEIAQEYLKKGSQIYVEGKLQTRSWQDDKGEKKYTTEVVAKELTMLGSKSSSNQEGAVSQMDEQKPPPIDDEIPF